MKVQHPYLEAMAVGKKDWPGERLPEIALVGRSNVGKSSLINRLCRRKQLAHTSAAPGKTATIHFYNMDEKFRLVDLPGYGYAKRSMKERNRWARFVNDYLADRPNLKEVVLICDIRREPKQMDEEMYAWIKEGGFAGTVLASKADKLTGNQRNKQLHLIRQSLRMPEEALLFPYSARTGDGMEAVEGYFLELLAGWK